MPPAAASVLKEISIFFYLVAKGRKHKYINSATIKASARNKHVTVSKFQIVMGYAEMLRPALSLSMIVDINSKRVLSCYYLRLAN